MTTATKKSEVEPVRNARQNISKETRSQLCSRLGYELNIEHTENIDTVALRFSCGFWELIFEKKTFYTWGVK